MREVNCVKHSVRTTNKFDSLHKDVIINSFRSIVGRGRRGAASPYFLRLWDTHIVLSAYLVKLLTDNSFRFRHSPLPHGAGHPADLGRMLA